MFPYEEKMDSWGEKVEAGRVVRRLSKSSRQRMMTARISGDKAKRKE